jgi:WD40 repeat protein
VWDLASVERDVLTPVQGEEAITSLALSSDGRFKVTGHADGSVLLRDLQDPSKSLETLWEPAADVRIAAVKISPDDRWLAAVSTPTESKTSQFKLWDLKAGLTAVLEQDGVAAVDFGPENRLVTGHADGTVRVREVTEAGLRQEVLFDWGQKLNYVRMSCDGRLLLSAVTQPGAARLWRHLDSRERAPIDLAVAPRPSRITAVAISPDSDWVAIALALGEREPPPEYALYLWNLKTTSADKAPEVEPTKILEYAGEVTALAMTTDDTLVAASGDGAVRVYELSSVQNGGKAKRVFPTYDGPIATVKISPDGKQFFTGGPRARARLWDLEDGLLPIVVSEAETGFVDGVFTPAGLVTASMNGSVRRSILDLDALKLEARRRVGRNLSHEEWEQSFPGESYRKTFSDLPAPEGAK